jgi:hypothetical protein
MQGEGFSAFDFITSKMMLPIYGLCARLRNRLQSIDLAAPFERRNKLFLETL